MAKLLLKLHQPYKWKKHNYFTDEDYYEAERLIYNNLSMEPYLDKIIPELDDSWVNDFLKEDEAFDYLEGELNNYVITTYGRVFNLKTKKTVMPSVSGTNLNVMLKGKVTSYKTEFARLGWVYSFSFIMDIYAKYKWKYYVGYKVKK